MPRPRSAITPIALGITLVAPLTDLARAQRAVNPTAAPATGVSVGGAFVVTDSTLLVVVPSGASAISVLGAVGAVRGRTVTAVYTTDDADSRALAGPLATTVGASLIPYDRAGASPAAYAATLVRNAVGANPRGTVLVVAPPELTDPLFRETAAASGVATAPGARAGGRPNGVVVLAVAPHTRGLVRARF